MFLHHKSMELLPTCHSNCGTAAGGNGRRLRLNAFICVMLIMMTT